MEEVPLPLPPPLKSALEDDCFWIVHRAKLVQLPAQHTVENLLRTFYQNCLEGSADDVNCPCPSSFQLLAEVLDGIKVYFDFTLADHLLYGQEKEQHKLLGILNPVFSKKTASLSVQQESGPQTDLVVTERQLQETQGRLPSQVYGPIHLLRLFVKFPRFLLAAQIPSSHIQPLHNCFRDFLGYLCSRRHDFFLEENYYEIVSSVTSNCAGAEPG